MTSGPSNVSTLLHSLLEGILEILFKVRGKWSRFIRETGRETVIGVLNNVTEGCRPQGTWWKLALPFLFCILYLVLRKEVMPTELVNSLL